MATVLTVNWGSYANLAAALADGWAETDTGNIVTWSLDATQVLTSTGKSLRGSVTGLTPAGYPYVSTIAKTFSGFTPGRVLEIQAKQFNVVGGTVPQMIRGQWYTPRAGYGYAVANGSGEITVSIALTIAGGSPTDTAWIDDVHVTDGVLAAIDWSDILLDAGVLLIDGLAYRPGRNGWAFDPQKQIETGDYEGDAVPFIGADEVTTMRPAFRGTLLCANATGLLLLEPGGSTATTGTVTSRSPAAIGSQIAASQVLTDVAVRWPRVGGGFLKVRFPAGVCTQWQLVGRDKTEAEFAVTIEARAVVGLDNSIGALYTVDRY